MSYGHETSGDVMSQINESLHTSFVTLVADMQRLSETEVVTVVGILKALESDLTTRLISDPDATATTKARLNALISQCKKDISAAYKRLNEIHQDFLTDTGSATQEAIYSVFSDVGIPLYSVMLNSDQLKTLASNTLIQGAPSASWWSKQNSNLQFSFANQIRLGFAAGETIDQIIRRVRGTSTGRGKFLIDGEWKEMGRFSGGVIEVSRRQAAALVRTSVQQVAADVRMKTFKRNSDLIECVMWSATLDHRTTLLCASRDGLTYTLDGAPIDHNLDFLGGPPAHWNCRSALVPVTKSWESIGMSSKIDKIWKDALSGDVRSSLNGNVPSTMNFSEWFAKLSKSEQVLYLGKRKYEIWKRAGLNLSDLVNQQGNPLTIKQLLQKYGSRMVD